MDFLREIVGGPKNRFKESGYNLDLTYITDRVIAMAFPASGIQKLYRNSVDSVQEFLANAHQNKYITVNISGRQIQDHKLQNVHSYEWQDHKAPPFDLLFVISDEVAKFLDGDPDRVSVFHCNHGKGRTGTIICCFFLFLGIFKEAKDVMKFYALRRFAEEGHGVTQPCQIKYIEYVEQIIANPTVYPRVYKLEQVRFQGAYSFKEPYIKVFRMTGRDMAYNSKAAGDKFYENQNGLTLKIKPDVVLAGDVSIQLKDSKAIGTNFLISYIFNTAFLKKEQLVIPLSELSPLGKQKLSNFGPTFHLIVIVKLLCPCGQQKKGAGCNLCKGVMKEQVMKWDRISGILKRRETFSSKGRQLANGQGSAKK